jgi:hypothetical protein
MIRPPIVFIGPTGYGLRVDRFARSGPASLGSLFKAFEEGYKTFVLVDGLYGTVPSVWHKEIFYLLSQRCTIYGLSSIGALRAADMAHFGMQGFGLIYRLYRSATIVDDDEVCILHAGEELDYMPLTQAMINLRFTFRNMRRQGILSYPDEQLLCERAKAVHFSERSDATIVDLIKLVTNLDQSAAALLYNKFKVNQKRRDLDSFILSFGNNLRQRTSLPIDFPATYHWNEHFIGQLK